VAFAQRRKTLRNALSALLDREQISACGIDPGARPQTLTPAAFNTLARGLDRARR
jgi:16S rRNA (adenine1518-N6/adenine1519-N6)-dimethyltransferase